MILRGYVETLTLSSYPSLDGSNISAWYSEVGSLTSLGLVQMDLQPVTLEDQPHCTRFYNREKLPPDAESSSLHLHNLLFGLLSGAKEKL